VGLAHHPASCQSLIAGATARTAGAQRINILWNQSLRQRQSAMHLPIPTDEPFPFDPGNPKEEINPSFRRWSRENQMFLLSGSIFREGFYCKPTNKEIL
jgi:hypothetical protein